MVGPKNRKALKIVIAFDDYKLTVRDARNMMPFLHLWLERIFVIVDERYEMRWLKCFMERELLATIVHWDRKKYSFKWLKCCHRTVSNSSRKGARIFLGQILNHNLVSTTSRMISKNLITTWSNSSNISLFGSFK